MSSSAVHPLFSPHRRPLFARLGLLASLGAAVLVGCHNQQATLVTTEPAVVKTITQLVSATGKIQPEVEVKIAPEVSGEIVELPYRDGAAVKKGELLLKIKPDNYQFQVAQQEASLAASKAMSQDSAAKLAKAKDDLKRDADLHDKKLLNDSDYATAQTTLQSAQAGYDSALANIKGMEGQLNQSRDLLKKTSIFSPIDGTISSLSNELGETVAGTGQYGGAEVLRVADLTSMELQVNINENDIVNVKAGDPARVSIDAFPKRKFKGVVKDIATAAKTSGTGTQDEVTNFLVKIRILDKDAALKPGMSASADVETQTVEHVVAVPIQAVTVRTRGAAMTMDEQAKADSMAQAQNGQGEGAATALNAKQQKEQAAADRDALDRVVFIYDNGKVRQVPVVTGIADATSFEIKSGVKAGDIVVNGSYMAITRLLKDGMAVSLAPALGTPPAADKK